MTFTSARNTSHETIRSTHSQLAKHPERLRIGSSLNGLERVLEPSRRRAFLARTLG